MELTPSHQDLPTNSAQEHGVDGITHKRTRKPTKRYIDESSNLSLKKCKKRKQPSLISKVKMSTVRHVKSQKEINMGTEMTSIPSQDPSMTSTPVGATTPLRSPNSSIPSTPRRGVPNTTPVGIDESRNPKELTEQEVKVRTRKEIL
ncbi:hypothetical protein L2E82_00956 [Cichorium intybus]|uniref:Uncharacterized protein n=1 Tax=Cichorium intybus TaxID=13427 RepID=A0ACB9GX89_CICIN|nr:hypothetical protein L2E82_00956 [Cichorium intybus]